MVPMEMLTSILDEPSNGSNNTRWLPFSLQAIKVSSSSLASPATLGVAWSAAINSWLASTSKFFCVSP